jgi:hypothetical protein
MGADGAARDFGRPRGVRREHPRSGGYDRRTTKRAGKRSAAWQDFLLPRQFIWHFHLFLLAPLRAFVGRRRFQTEPGCARDKKYAADIFAAGGGRQRGRRRTIAGLLPCAEESRSSRGNAFVRKGRAWVRAAAHETPDFALAWIGGNVAENHRNDSRMIRARGKEMGRSGIRPYHVGSHERLTVQFLYGCRDEECE